MESALLVIDAQLSLLSATPEPFELNGMLDNINILIDAFRSAQKLFVFVQHETLNGDLKHRSAGWELDPRIHALPTDHRIRKNTPDSFLGTDLNGLLMSQGIKTLYVCGYATEFCIDTSIRRGAAIGYDMVLVADAHTTHDKDHAKAKEIRIHHQKTLERLTSFEGSIQVKTTAELLRISSFRS